MSSKADLNIDYCSRAAARYAVEHWHYSQAMPTGKLSCFGVWEAGQFIGAVIFGRGANRNIGSPFGLPQVEACELVRIAMTNHVSSVTRIVSVCFKRLRRACPGLRLVVSYADPEQGHHGGIYQAGNWVYTGTSNPQGAVLIGGKSTHKRSASSRFGTVRGLQMTQPLWKHRYAYPLDKSMRSYLEALAKPYPKRAASIDSDAPGSQSGEGGVIPTAALQSTPVLANG